MKAKTATVDADSRKATAMIFNSAVATAAISAAWELGALDELGEHQELDVGEFCEHRNLDRDATMAMFVALASVDVTGCNGTTVTAGPNFAEVYRAKGFFHWLSRGCGQLFSDMPMLLRNETRNGVFYRRDAAAISIACRDINARFFDPSFHSALADNEFSRVADLGCGSGERLIRVARQCPEATGLGIDIADGALSVAREMVSVAGLADRISFTQADVRVIEPCPEFADVDLLTCFLMGHDFWPRDNCIQSLRRLRAAFPNVRKFLLGDTARTSGIPHTDIPVFTLGFEVAHAMMGVYLPTLEQWDGVFEEGGWRCARKRTIQTPAASVIFELEPL